MKKIVTRRHRLTDLFRRYREAVELFEDFIGGFCPDEGSGVTVVIGDVASDSVAGPDRAIGCCDGNCVAVPPDDLARGAFKAFGSMRIMQIEASSAEAAFEAGAAIGAPNFPKHLAGVIARPVDDAIPLVHRGLPTRGRHPSWDKVAALEAGDGFQKRRRRPR